MTEKQLRTSILFWDSNEIPNNQDSLIYTLNGYEEKDSVFSHINKKLDFYENWKS